MCVYVCVCVCVCVCVHLARTIRELNVMFLCVPMVTVALSHMLSTPDSGRAQEFKLKQQTTREGHRHRREIHGYSLQGGNSRDQSKSNANALYTEMAVLVATDNRLGSLCEHST